MLSAINPCTNYNPSFGQVNLVRVSKKAFSKPDDLLECTKEFGKTLNATSGNKWGDFDRFLAFIGLGKKAKTFHNLEGCCGVDILGAKQNEGEHAFCVLTGKDKDVAADIASISGTVKFYKELIKKSGGIEQFPLDKAKQEVMTGNAVSEKFRASINIENRKEFKIEKLEELLGLKTKLGL